MSKKCDDEYDSKTEGKFGGGKSADVDDDDDLGGEDGPGPDVPLIEVTAIEIDPVQAEIDAPLNLKIKFELDRDVVAANWIVKVSE